MPKRITPAGAGKTGSRGVRNQPLEDHPRRCGENFVVSRPQRRATGSPPQVRGKQSNVGVALYATRITPAGAGKTLCLSCFVTAQGDHPRRCGENSSGFVISFLLSGSPPQVRGKLLPHLSFLSSLRITPAGAGKTVKENANYGNRKDHPRRCGENRSKITLITSSLGSPPQVRGKPDHRPWQGTVRGITPAGAGKTAAVAVEKSDAAGSPPQVRGKHFAYFILYFGAGITPAGAGKTLSTA